MSSLVETSTTRSYLDFSGLGELRGQAQQNQDKALKESAQQFEGLFIQMMMKSMREATMKDEDNQSSGVETFEGMFDKEVSMQMAKRSALGVADYMAKAVKQNQPSTADMLKARQVGGMALNPKEPALPMNATPAVNPLKFNTPVLKPLHDTKKMLGGGS